MSGKEFMETFAPFTIPKVLSAKWLWENKAVLNGDTLLVSISVYDCLVDPKTVDAIFERLEITYVPKVTLRDMWSIQTPG